MGSSYPDRVAVTVSPAQSLAHRPPVCSGNTLSCSLAQRKVQRPGWSRGGGNTTKGSKNAKKQLCLYSSLLVASDSCLSQDRTIRNLNHKALSLSQLWISLSPYWRFPLRSRFLFFGVWT